jgi:hypothetical protein
MCCGGHALLGSIHVCVGWARSLAVLLAAMPAHIHAHTYMHMHAHICAHQRKVWRC